jgi:hypothetical protein
MQSNLYLCTQLVKNGCTYCKKYLNQGMDSDRLHVEWFNWPMTFPKLPKDIKLNVNWNQTLLNEVDLNVTWSWSH